MKNSRMGLVLFTAVCMTFLMAADIPELTRQAESGDANAQFDLAVKYYFGEDVEQNYENAFFWMKKAAEQGEVAAEYNLAYMYQTGEGIEIDIDLVREWYEKAADKEYQKAKISLGFIYYNGSGFE